MKKKIDGRALRRTVAQLQWNEGFKT